MVEELNSSELGTKKYWEDSYSSELKNYKNHGDVGEIWFDEDSQLRIINWILKKDDIESTSKIVDLGCGNGMFCIELAREGYTNITGIDYSPNAVQLASSIADDQDLAIKYQILDLLNKTDVISLGKFDVVHDKGTYDAISLHPDNPREKRNQYMESVYTFLNDSGLFIITSCNWTEDELITTFSAKFDKHCSIKTPTFKFGGKVGNVVTSAVFVKKI